MRKKIILIASIVFACFLMAGCQTQVNKESQADVKKDVIVEKKESTRTFIDSAGREVLLPTQINQIAPSGPLAQIVLYTVCPDKLAGLSADFSEEAKQLIDEKYWGLPKFGQFYGKNASLNMEALMQAAPDVIVDIGEAKETVKEDMDALQEQIGIPVVFIEATLPTMEKAYAMLGELTGETEQAAKLGAYCKEVMDYAVSTAKERKVEDKKSVYFALGDSGLSTNAKGSFHAEILDVIGAENAADVEMASSGGGSEVSFEQILLWQPDIIIVDTKQLYDQLLSDPLWSELEAVKSGNIYKIPTVPYNFMSSPPSVNRIIGINWLGSIAYPTVFTEDILEEVKEFYSLFYHLEISKDDLSEILEK